MGRGIIFLCLSLFVELAMGQSYLDMRHHSYREMKEYLQLVNNICPEQSRLYSIGKSVQGRDLLVLELGTSPGQDQVCFWASDGHVSNSEIISILFSFWSRILNMSGICMETKLLEKSCFFGSRTSCVKNTRLETRKFNYWWIQLVFTYSRQWTLMDTKPHSIIHGMLSVNYCQ